MEAQPEPRQLLEAELGNLSLDELKARCREAGTKYSGTKKNLIVFLLSPASHQSKRAAGGAARKTQSAARKKSAQRSSSDGAAMALLLPASMWGRVFGFVDDTIDDLGVAKGAVRLALTCTRLKANVASAKLEIWNAALYKIARRSPCLATFQPCPGQTPWAALTTLSSACAVCRGPTRCAPHTTYGVKICAGCNSQKGGGLVVMSEAKGKYRLTETQLAAIPFTTRPWYGKEKKLFVKRQLVLAQAARFASRAAFDALDRSRKRYNPQSLYNSSMLSRGMDHRFQGFYGEEFGDFF